MGYGFRVSGCVGHCPPITYNPLVHCFLITAHCSQQHLCLPFLIIRSFTVFKPVKIPVLKRIILFALCLLPFSAFAQHTETFTRQDTLRGTITPQRAWWDVVYYELSVTIHPADSTIEGRNQITYRVIKPARELQIDLQQPMQVTSITQEGQELKYRREGHAFFVTMEEAQPLHSLQKITVSFRGKPRVAQRPPWDGGFIWKKDDEGIPWVATANQGLGASAWWPNKDHQSEEPDSMQFAVTVPDPMVDVSNGRLRSRTSHADGTTTYTWFVNNPINNYDVAVNAGNYTHYHDQYQGEQGELDLDFWPLKQHLSKARRQFKQVRPMLKCFEHWFGPYPFYEDSYKLVEAPHLGMEHQSAVAYGNEYQQGYKGTDLSGTGWGLKWDFIIVHESGHEWFGNSITAKDIADMWIHESFTNYSESLYTECRFGKKAGAEYVIGLRNRVQNDRPIIGHYGVNNEGSGDMYYKGGNMLHTIRQIVNNDTTWRAILRGLNSEFRHQTVTTQQVESYISDHADTDLSKVFDQYLRHTALPTFEFYLADHTLYYRWKADVAGFNMPLKVTTGKGRYAFIHPGEHWQKMKIDLPEGEDFKVDRNFYVNRKAYVSRPATLPREL